MERLYLVRHGERSGIAKDTPLTNYGEKQAELTGKYLSTVDNISLIYASPLKRAQQTAEIISSVLKLPIFIDTRLLERMRFGDRAGESYSQFIRQWHETCTDRKYDPPMGDSSFNAGNRFKDLTDEISIGQNVVIVSHGGVIGDFLRNVFDDIMLPITFGSDQKAEFIDISYCSITEVSRKGSKYNLEIINDTTHLNTPVI